MSLVFRTDTLKDLCEGCVCQESVLDSGYLLLFALDSCLREPTPLEEGPSGFLILVQLSGGSLVPATVSTLESAS